MAKIMARILSKHAASSTSPSHSFCECTRFRRGTAARERKIEPRAARSLIPEINIVGENYERSIIPVCSDTSGFSTGTDGGMDGTTTARSLSL
jgi:hypothetical protein